MKEAASSLLKVLEEPPSNTPVSAGSGELLHHPLPLQPCASVLCPSKRSECCSPPPPDVSPAAADPHRPPRPGAAGGLSASTSPRTAARADALIFLRNAAATSSGTTEPDHTALFKMTETYRAGAEGQQNTSALLRTLSLLLEDLLLLGAGTP
jgi:DNA polymerase-3 subunit delta'